ncbi:MAG: MCE family protein [Mycobacteriaceae bacterium]
MHSFARFAGAFLVSSALVAVSTGCGMSAYDVPLPGGADLGDNPLHLTLQFRDVLDLVPQSTVKVNGVPVGRVESISVPENSDEWIADIKVVLRSDAKLPKDAVAQVQQSNLLGEKFIDISAPKVSSDPSPMPDGYTIGVANTSQTTDIEQVLGALALLLDGGGVSELKPIITSLTTALDGREGTARSLLENANKLIAGLDAQRDDITRALDGLGALSSSVAQQTGQIEKVLDELPAGVKVLEEQRPQLIQMLTQVDRLGVVGTDILSKSKDNLITDLKALRPTLQALASGAPDLITALPILPTYPFPDEILQGTLVGSSANIFLSLDLQLGDTLSNLGVGKPDPVYVQPRGVNVNVDPTNPYYNGNGPRPGWPTISLLPVAPIKLAPVPVPEDAPSSPFDQLLNSLGLGGR